jgi:hypothetical protein
MADADRAPARGRARVAAWRRARATLAKAHPHEYRELLDEIGSDNRAQYALARRHLLRYWELGIAELDKPKSAEPEPSPEWKG